MFWSRPRTDGADGRLLALSGGGSLSIVAADFQITGTLRSTGEIHIDGIVNGEVVANIIMVGHSGTVIGDLVAEQVTIAGTVHGTVTATSVTLKKTARVHADVRCDVFDSAEGAILELQGQSAEPGSSDPEPPPIGSKR